MDGMILDRTRLDAGEDFPDEIASYAPEVDRSAGFPWQSLDVLHREGLLALTARREDGGAEAGLGRVSDLVRTVGRACPSTALILSMQLVHLRGASRSRWPAHLQMRVGRSAGRFGALINALRVEPALGTPARGGLPGSVARRVGDEWSITGRKIYSTGAPGLTWMLVFARVEAGSPPDRDEAEPRMGMFLVPARSDGVRIEDTWDQLGLRGSCSHDVVLEDVRVPADHAVDLRPASGWKLPDPDAAAWSALTIAALYTGVAEAARDWVCGFLRDRAPSNLGAPLATLPRMQEAVGRMDATLLVNRRLVASAASDTDAGHPPTPAESGLIKTVAAENAITTVELAMSLAGNHGLSRANPLERHLRDVLCSRVHTPQPDAALTAAGRLALAQ